jgi:hypothetical protein
MNTLQQIDRLSEERSRLYRQALGERRKDPEVKQRIADITAELDLLWDVRRQERVGKLEGIDLLVEQSYSRIYGDKYRDVVAPVAVEAEQEAVAA